MNMSRIKTTSVVCLLFLVALGFTLFASSQATSNNPARTAQGENAQMMQSLLNEVRQLRLAIQRANLSAYHAQVIIERMRSQQQHVDRLTERLRETRDRIANGQMRRAELQDMLKKIESRLSRAAYAERSAVEGEQEFYKNRSGLLAQEEARLREQESQLAAQLEIEQVKLTDLNDRLDALQRELEILPAEDKLPQGAKRP
jgi:hypothetical protein